MMNLETPQPKTDRELLEEIHDNSRKAKNYMKWQLIITVALVVLPLLATLIAIPYAMRSLTSMYSIDGLNANGTEINSVDAVQDFINQFKSK